MDYGAKGDALIFTDGAMTAASATLKSSTATFTSLDVGKLVVTSTTGTGLVPQKGTITAVGGAHSITVSFTAQVTVSSALEFGYGSDDQSAIVNALADLAGTGATLRTGAGAPGVTGFMHSSTFVVPGGLTLDCGSWTLPFVAWDPANSAIYTVGGSNIHIANCENRALVPAPLQNVQTGSNPNRLGPYSSASFYFKNSSNSTFVNLHAYRVANAGIVARSITSSKFDRITAQETMADGLHFVGCSGNDTVSNLQSIDVGDDGLSFIGSNTEATCGGIGNDSTVYTFRGLWAVGTAYALHDTVTYISGATTSTYVAVATSTGVTPGTNPAKWIAVDPVSNMTATNITAIRPRARCISAEGADTVSFVGVTCDSPVAHGFIIDNYTGMVTRNISVTDFQMKNANVSPYLGGVIGGNVDGSIALDGTYTDTVVIDGMQVQNSNTILFLGPRRSSIKNSKITDTVDTSGYGAISIQDGSDVAVENNEVTNSKYSGIRIAGTAKAHVSHNQLKGVQSIGDGGGDIQVIAGTSAVLPLDVTGSGNTSTGVTGTHSGVIAVGTCARCEVRNDPDWQERLFYNAASATDGKFWSLGSDPNAFHLKTLSDNFTTGSYLWSATRTGYALSNMTIYPALTLNNALSVAGDTTFNSPRYFYDSGGPTDGKWSRQYTSHSGAQSFYNFDVLNDAKTTGSTVFQVTRTGFAISDFSFYSPVFMRGTFNIPGGSAGKVLTSDSVGGATWGTSVINLNGHVIALGGTDSLVPAASCSAATTSATVCTNAACTTTASVVASITSVSCTISIP